MKIGIDISQIAFENTGVANYLKQLVHYLVQVDQKNEYILFYSSLRKQFQISNFPTLLKLRGAGNFQISNKNVRLKVFRIPPTVLDMLWNRLHIFPIEWLIGDVDVFISSDWTEPPVKNAKKATILYDLIVYKYPEETAQSIVEVQKRKLAWVKKESDMIFCISESTKKDAEKILGISKSKLHVLYPGV